MGVLYHTHRKLQNFFVIFGQKITSHRGQPLCKAISFLICAANHALCQARRLNSTRMGKISRRPITISNDNTSLLKSEK